MGKGTGLGLSQVYGFVQQANGDMVISSVPNHNTVISLFLPVSATTDGQVAAKKSKIERVLVVDDQSDVLDMAVELFSMLGYEVLAAQSGDEALNLLKQNSDINILFSDVVMPDINGVELANRARMFLPDLKVILASGYPGSALKAENYGIQNFPLIAKPYKLADIARQLRAA